MLLCLLLGGPRLIGDKFLPFKASASDLLQLMHISHLDSSGVLFKLFYVMLAPLVAWNLDLCLPFCALTSDLLQLQHFSHLGSFNVCFFSMKHFV